MPRRRWTLAALIAVIAVTGCGSTSAQDEVRNTMQAWHDAFVDGDGRRWCDMLTPAARRTVERDNAALGYPSCVEMIDRAGPRLTQEQARALRALRVRDVRVVKRRAVVRATDIADFGADGIVDEHGTVLMRENDSWRIHDFG